MRFVVTFLALNYCAAVFALYEWHKAVAVWRAWGFYGHVVSVAILVAAAAADAVCGRAKPAAKGAAAAAAKKGSK